MVYWTAKAAQDTPEVDEIVIATDSEDIKQAVINFKFSKLKVYERSSENAGDASSTESVMLEYLDNYNAEISNTFILIQATSPFLLPSDLSKGIQQLKNSKSDSLLSCANVKRFFWSKNGQPLNYDYNNRPRRQDFDGTLIENGAFYINSISNMITDIATWNGTGVDQKLNQYEVFKNILSEEIANFSCHGGFAKTLSKYYQEIRTEMDKYSSTANHIVFSGHSAGGGLATLCYYVYQNDRNTKDKINVEYTVTYGSPRCVINDTNNINKFNKTCPNMLRVFNINDIVSYLPFNKGNFMFKNIANGFVHVGKPFPLDSNVDDNSLNALVLLILKGQKDKYKQLIKNFTLDEIRENEVIKFITSDKYLSVLSGCVFQCYSKVGVKERVPDEMITLYTQELFKRRKNIRLF